MTNREPTNRQLLFLQCQGDAEILLLLLNAGLTTAAELVPAVTRLNIINKAWKLDLFDESGISEDSLTVLRQKVLQTP